MKSALVLSLVCLLTLGLASKEASGDQGRAHDVSGIVKDLDSVAAKLKVDVHDLDVAVAQSEQFLMKANHPGDYTKEEVEEAETKAEALAEHQKQHLNVTGDLRKGNSTETHLCQVTNFPARIASIAGFSLGYQLWFAGFSIEQGISFDDFLQTLSGFFEKDVIVDIAAGIGTYYGVDEASEYLIIALPAANMDMWKTASDDTGLEAIPSISFEGNVFKIAGSTKSVFLRGRYPQEFAFNIVASFNPCSSLIATYEVQFTPSLGKIISSLVNTQHAKYLGNFDTCMFHEKYCAGDHRQYANFSECMNYMDSLPLISGKCGDTRPFAGSSRSCKMKHKLMAAHAVHHCVHLGPLYKASGEPNKDHLDRWKCSDEEECRGSEGDSVKVPISEPSKAWFAALDDYDRWVETKYTTDGTLAGYKFPTASNYNSRATFDETIRSILMSVAVGLLCFACGALLVYARCRRPAELKTDSGDYTELTSKGSTKASDQS